MNSNQKKDYLAPKLNIFEFKLEMGFAASTPADALTINSSFGRSNGMEQLNEIDGFATNSWASSATSGTQMMDNATSGWDLWE